MSVVNIRHGQQSFAYKEVVTLEQALENSRTVLRQKEKQLQSQGDLVRKLEAALAELREKVAADKERKAKAARERYLIKRHAAE